MPPVRDPLPAVPLEYETAHRPRRWGPVTLAFTLILAFTLVAIVLLAGLLFFTRLSFTVRPTIQPTVQIGGPQTSPPPPLPVPTQDQAETADLLAEGVELTLKQRQERWLPGGQLKLTIDDITGGQVLVSVSDVNGVVIAGPQSMRPDDVISLGTSARPTELRLQRLANHLTGDDFAVFRLGPAASEDENPTTRP